MTCKSTDLGLYWPWKVALIGTWHSNRTFEIPIAFTIDLSLPPVALPVLGIGLLFLFVLWSFGCSNPPFIALILFKAHLFAVSSTDSSVLSVNTTQSFTNSFPTFTYQTLPFAAKVTRFLSSVFAVLLRSLWFLFLGGSSVG